MARTSLIIWSTMLFACCKSSPQSVFLDMSIHVAVVSVEGKDLLNPEEGIYTLEDIAFYNEAKESVDVRLVQVGSHYVWQLFAEDSSNGTQRILMKWAHLEETDTIDVIVETGDTYKIIRQVEFNSELITSDNDFRMIKIVK